MESQSPVQLEQAPKPYKAPLRERASLWWTSLPGIPARAMASYLKRRGWVAFYLDPAAQHCTAVCWLQEYRKSERLPDLGCGLAEKQGLFAEGSIFDKPAPPAAP